MPLAFPFAFRCGQRMFKGRTLFLLAASGLPQKLLVTKKLLLPSSKALVTSSVALVSTSFLLLVVRHLLLRSFKFLESFIVSSNGLHPDSDGLQPSIFLLTSSKQRPKKLVSVTGETIPRAQECGQMPRGNNA